LKSLNKSFDACEKEIRKLSKSLGIEIQTNIDPEKVKITFKKKAKWPFEKNEVAQILCVIECYKENLILAITGDSLEVGLDVSETVAEISNTLQTMVLDQKDKKVLDWIDLCDTSANHAIAREKHQPTTGDWFLESDSFLTWSDANNASLWLHGIPGAGKTVLC
jgi:hypothetical protein